MMIGDQDNAASIDNKRPQIRSIIGYVERD
jgi:hypothetical protein